MQHCSIEATAFGDEQVLEGCFDLGWLGNPGAGPPTIYIWRIHGFTSGGFTGCCKTLDYYSSLTVLF